MRKTLKTEQDRQTALQGIKAAANHHASTINTVIDDLYEAIMQYKDSDSLIIFTSYGIEFKANGSIYRLSYKNQQIELFNVKQIDTILAQFDNSIEKAKVMESFQNL